MSNIAGRLEVYLDSAKLNEKVGDPYCKLIVGTSEHKSAVHKKSNEPSFKQGFSFTLYGADPYLTIILMDEDFGTDDIIGKVSLPLNQPPPAGPQWFDLFHDREKAGAILMTITFTPQHIANAAGPPQGYQGGPPPQGFQQAPPQGYGQQQGGYPPQQQGYPPQGAPGYPPQQQYPQQGHPGYPPQGAPGYPPQQHGYPPQGAPGYPPQGAPGYPPQQQGYPHGAPGYPPQGAPYAGGPGMPHVQAPYAHAQQPQHYDPMAAPPAHSHGHGHGRHGGRRERRRRRKHRSDSRSSHSSSTSGSDSDCYYRR
eukprot:TRINITY_DN97438_c0_g1_i1.p1 TRINITY_DN97438_c0_g1~~TRINITY_DN97438_c0_g1_i1.p1  ORF type:complete len:310 (-),score=-5.49 TRINITY_DN97438_c0_g1_i1:94-1023(-)